MAATEGGTTDAIVPHADDALLVIDVQEDFIPGGSLAVPDGDAVIPLINQVARAFANVVLTQDWHPPGHISFASAHPGRVPLDAITVSYGRQVLWPDHCVQASAGAGLARGLGIPHAGLVLRKGYERDVDSYSAFNAADGQPTGLAAYLRERRIGRVFLAGLATDFCVGYSAIDARKAGFDAVVIEDACRGIDADGSLAAAWDAMERAGVRRIHRADLAAPSVPAVSR
jgi:nicotinamidase/pyrazinamidase